MSGYDNTRIEFTVRHTLDDLPFLPHGRAVALGMFDGIHEGHIEIIRAAVRYAASHGLKSLVQTFVNLPKTSDGELTTIAEKTGILTKLGVDELLVIDYNEVHDMTPAEFVSDVILIRMGAHAIFTGEDYRYGKGASGEVTTLTEQCRELGIDTFVHNMCLADGTKISSTRLKEALRDGHPEEYIKLTGGRPFIYEGTVVKGKQLGRTMGFPTANINIPEGKYHVRRGVYASRVYLGSRVLQGVTNIGLRPTVEDAVADVCETYIFDFDEDIYGAFIRVELLGFIRDETRFSSREELIAAVENDKILARS
ncbi:riboflavin kinase / FMN adenylyltransferase [Ruminococcaceae bacterium YRB3002]|nr:riboflavin kinase / FMN adenylyltransferase [Ruminococcaceae bacterium YRB3002]